MEVNLNCLSARGWSRATHKDAGYDMQIETAKGQQVLAFKRFSGSTRDLRAALLQLALVLEENSDVDRAYLVASLPRMTEKRACARVGASAQRVASSSGESASISGGGQDPNSTAR